MKRLFFIAFVALSVHTFAQTNEDAKNQIIETRVEYLLENSDAEDADFLVLFDKLLYYFDKPLNLNRASFDELDDLTLLNDIQINNLLKHIQVNGKLITLEELQTINGFDLETIWLILPFVKVSGNVDDTKASFSQIMKYGKHQLFIRYTRVLEEQKSFSPTTDSALAANPNSRYPGSPDKLYTRYRFNYGTKISVGITAEKDAGEEFLKGNQPNGFDFYSAHFFIRDQKFIKQLALGDFQAQFGQGLTFWSGRAFGKTADIMLTKRNAQSLRPYTSVDENLFLRGGGTTIAIKNIEITAFGSSNKIDANLSTDTFTTQEQTFTSFQTSGIHATPNEIKNKDAIVNNIFGGHIAYKKRNINVGITGAYNEFNSNFTPNLSTYSKFRLSSNTNSVVGVDYNYIFKNINIFGEVAKNINGSGNAQTYGALLMLDPKLSFALLHRNISRDFNPIYSNAVTEGSTVENEIGTYVGAVFKPIKHISISGYIDRFRFPWLRYQVDAPSGGYQYISQINWTPTKKLDVYFRIRQRVRGKNSTTDEEGVDAIVDENQINYRVNLSYGVNEFIRLKSRVEWTHYQLGNEKDETGFIAYQDVIFNWMKSPVSFALRYALFDTESYTSRIYTYETDVLYYFSIPSYYYRGSRVYAMIRYGVSKNVDLWLRWSQTFYNNKTTVSSGMTEIQGNTKSEIKAQLRISF